MRKYPALNFLLAVLMVFSVVSPVSAATSLFADPDLERVVRDHFYDLEEGEEITPETLSELYWLWGENENIDNLKGLEYASSLGFLYLPDNQISDLTPLKDLTNLDGVALNNNQVTDLTPLQKSTNMYSLEVANNQVSNISVITKLTKLEYIDLSSNQISDITALKNQPSKYSLDLNLANNQITDLSPLATLNVTDYVYLNVSENNVSNLDALSNLSKVTKLSAAGNNLTHVKSLSKLTKLDHLDVSNNQITSLQGIPQFVYGTYDFSDNQISSIQELSTVTSGDINLSGNNIADITPLKNMTSGALNVLGNPLNQQSLDLISVLEDRGVLVEYAENVDRIAGNTRFETAVSISQQGWEQADTVIIVRGDDFPDALAGAPLAAMYDAPILMAGKDSLGVAEWEIYRLGATNAIILGGTAGVSEAVESQLESMGLETRRIGGATRYETSKLIANELGVQDKAVVAYGRNFPDALAAASYAAMNGIPILLTEQNSIPAETKALLADKTTTYVVGGPAVISDSVFAQLPGAVRISGNTRYGTAANLITQLGMSTEQVFIANGRNFADALTGSVLAAKLNAPLLLVEKDYIPEETKAIISSRGISEFVILGGKAAVSNNVFSELVK